jgi:hypothetical protein
MGWRSKFLMLLIVYFAGFATAAYYLAPSGREGCQAGSYYSSDDGSQSGSVFREFCDKAVSKASASFSSIDWEDLKERFNCAMQKLIARVKSSRNSVEGGAEDK